MCTKLALFTDYTGMDGQQNIKYILNPILLLYFKYNGMSSGGEKKTSLAYFMILSVMNGSQRSRTASRVCTLLTGAY
jgi:hypothetical protein